MNELLLHQFNDLFKRSTQRYTFSDFLSLDEISVLKQSKLPCTLWGGANDCERVMACFGDESELGYSAEFPIACIFVCPLSDKFSQDLTHRDFLGALMNLGIERKTIGDISIPAGSRKNCAYIFCSERMAEYICENLTRVKNTSVSAKIEKTPQNIVRLFNKEEIIVSSLRLDCVIAGVFNISRSAACRLLNTEKVFVDGRAIQNNSYCLKENQTVSVRGSGKFIFRARSGMSKKGRLYIQIYRFI